MSKNSSSTHPSLKIISRDSEASPVRAVWPPVLGICGFSGSGKTTLIERLVPRLTARGLAVAVIKHDAHRLLFDQPGKDTDRIYRSGADVLAHDPRQTVLRLHGTATLEEVLRLLPCRYDLVLVEGHKASPVPKLWLLDDGRRKPPTSTSNVIRVIPPTEDVLSVCESELDAFLAAYHKRLPTCAAILPGERPATPTLRKRLHDSLRCLGCEVFDLSRALDGKNARPAPMRPPSESTATAIQTALHLLRGNPFVRWLFVREDITAVVAARLRELLEQCGPGCWAVVPRVKDWPNAVPPVLVCLPPAVTILANTLFSERPLATQPRILTTRPPA